MNVQKINIKTSPLQRVKLNISPEELFVRIQKLYNIGTIASCKVFGKGVIEVNIKVTTTTGDFVLKIFSEKKYWRVKQLTHFMRSIKSRGVKVQKIVPTLAGKLYFRIRGEGKYYYACLLSYFHGRDFSTSDPSLEKIIEIAKSLAIINKDKIEVAPHYDECLIPNLPHEFKKKAYLIKNKKYKNILFDYSRKISTINFNLLQNGVIHGDLSREHVLARGKDICLLDFGALNWDKVVVDLAIAMSWFCMDVHNFSKEKFWIKYNLFLETYKKYIKLSDYEIKVLPILICANYAMNYLLGKYYLEVIGEPHAKYYADFGKRGIDLVDPLIEQPA